MILPCGSKMEITSQDDLEKLSQMNAKGFDLICEGFVDDAENILSSCLMIAMEGVPRRPLREWANPETDSMLDNLPLFDAILPEGFATDHPGRFSFYPHAFGANELGFRDVRTFIAVAAYNLAMLHHETGLYDYDMPTLSKARTLYKLCLVYLPRQSSASTWLGLAAWNNMGHLASFFGDDEGVQFCLNGLRERLLHEPLDSWRWFRGSLANAEAGGVKTFVVSAPVA